MTRAHRHRALLAAATATWILAPGPSAAEPADLIREQRTVVVGGARETWRLEWESRPTSACGPEDVAAALACPCSGFAYGEAGRLLLVRLRPGAVRETLDLTGFFRHREVPVPGDLAVLRHWPPVPATAHDEDDDWHHASDLNFLARVRARGADPAMRIGDYNHDGRASEFLLQVGAQGCDRHVMVLVGVSRYNTRLHVFAAAEAPDVPLELEARTWEAIRAGRPPAHVVETRCADRVETQLGVEVRNGIFHVQPAQRPCPDPAGPADPGSG